MNKIIAAFFGGWLLMAALAGPVAAANVVVSNEVPGPNAYIPKGTLIEAELLTRVNSGEKGVNDVAYFRVNQNVSVDGVVVLPSGTIGTAYITAAQSAGYLGKSGKIEMTVSNIQALNGALIPLTLDVKRYGGRVDEDLPSQLAAIYSTGIHQLGSLFAAFRGADVEIPAGTKFQVAVEYDADLGCPPSRLDCVMIKVR